jgi:capsular polysaccharide biosynthesis protein
MGLCRLIDVLDHKELIFPCRIVPVDHVVAFSNTVSTYVNPAFGWRIAKLDEIYIGRLPPRVVLHGPHNFAASLGYTWVAESIPHYLHVQTAHVQPDSVSDPIPIEDECFLATRFGHGTWGHWLCEILPLVVVTEHMYPGRFRYAIAFYGGETARYGSRIVESLAAYGISENRLFRMEQNRSYVFSRASWMTPAWSDHMLHPDVATVMRGAVSLGPVGDLRRIMLFRRETRGRGLMNRESIEELLGEYDYAAVDIEDLSFIQQISVFRGVEGLFSVLGSSLSGLIYAPDFVTVATLRPQFWEDRFFTALMQMRRGKWADISGPTAGENPMRDPFSVEESHVASALQAIHPS